MVNLIFCFDGTCNEPEDARAEKSWLGLGANKDSNITNVLKLHLLFGGNLGPEPSTDEVQKSFYYSGVGTYGSRLHKLKNMIFAPADEDVGQIIKRGIRDLVKTYQPGDPVFVFGFSRGAAIARCFAARLETVWPALRDDPAPRIRFMGVFDTVAAVNKPNAFKQDKKPGSDVVFENHSLAHCVDEVLHLVALDERRIAFMPTLINQDDRVTEIWLPGAHADVGGGYRYDGLSDQALQLMLERVSESRFGLRLVAAKDLQFSQLEVGDEIDIELEDVVIQPNPYGRSHEQGGKTFFKDALLADRSLRVLVNDTTSKCSPLVHHSVLDRLEVDHDYRPEPLLQSRLVNPYSGDAIVFKIYDQQGQVGSQGWSSLKALQLRSRKPLRSLDPGLSAECVVYANQLFNASGILLQQGHRYWFEIDLEQRWFDGVIDCNAQGWTSDKDISGFIQRSVIKWKESDRRVADAHWFELCGTVNRSDTQAFSLLRHHSAAKAYSPIQDGELFTFANDLVDYYDNNMGLLKIKVHRI